MFNVGDVVIVNGYWPETGLKPMSIATITLISERGYMKLHPHRIEDRFSSIGDHYASIEEISHLNTCEKFHG